MVNDAPKFLIKMTFESNTAFFVAIFVLIAGVAWTLRDHRRRQLEIQREDYEDLFYMAVLTGLFIICTSGAYWIFRRQKLQREYAGAGHLVPIDKLIDDQVSAIMQNVAKKREGITYKEEDDEDFVWFLYGLALTTAALLGGWLWTRTGKKTQSLQYPSATASAAPDGSNPHSAVPQ